jgi:hypothetical protein
VQLVLQRKCQVKGIGVPTFQAIASSQCRQEFETEWQHMLGHQLGFLPAFTDYWAALPSFFAWLEGTEIAEDLELVSLSPDEQWEPPSVEWQRGQENRLEPVRFAAVNRLCISLGYQNSVRIIEPYSLRSTKDGFILLYALRADNRLIRAYRLDRIQSMAVTSTPYKPVFRVEFTPTGRLQAPQSVRRRSVIRHAGGTRYVVECSYCGKRFRRHKYSLRLKAHKHKGSDWNCPGRRAYLVDTYYG